MVRFNKKSNVLVIYGKLFSHINKQFNVIFQYIFAADKEPKKTFNGVQIIGRNLIPLLFFSPHSLLHGAEGLISSPHSQQAAAPLLQQLFTHHYQRLHFHLSLHTHINMSGYVRD